MNLILQLSSENQESVNYDLCTDQIYVLIKNVYKVVYNIVIRCIYYFLHEPVNQNR